MFCFVLYCNVTGGFWPSVNLFTFEALKNEKKEKGSIGRIRKTWWMPVGLLNEEKRKREIEGVGFGRSLTWSPHGVLNCFSLASLLATWATPPLSES